MGKKIEPRVRETKVDLLDDELVLLDGKVREEAQLEVDRAKARVAMREVFPELAHSQSGFIADVVGLATLERTLVFRHTDLRICPMCDRRPGYAKRTRTSSKGYKGEPDYSKPIHMRGVEFKHTFISVKGFPVLGCCNACFDIIREPLLSALENVEAELPEKLMGYPPKYRFFRNRKCKKCRWTGHEGEMPRLPSLMGGGSFPGVCPGCGYHVGLFDKTLEMVEGGVLVPASELPALEEKRRESRIRPKKPKRRAKKPAKKPAAT